MDDMRTVLDKAASSSDGAVRGMALRFREMQREQEQYTAFFELYRKATSGVAAVPVKAAVVAREPSTPVVKRRPRERKEDTFAESIRMLVTGHGRPMKLNEMHAAYLQQHSDDQTTVETFRQRLVKRRTHPDGVTPLIVLVPKQGYWWADATLPEGSGNV